jgi:signal transduction histidine kinase/ligand-binding sensor domain-containing protein
MSAPPSTQAFLYPRRVVTAASGARPGIGNWSRCLAAIVCGTAGFWLVSVACGAGAAPELTGEFAIETWMTENGMPQNSVTAVLQTREGYIWSGTYNGIAQFDGERFKLFDSSNTKGLVNSRVTCMYEDARGAIWIGHDTGELTRHSERRFQPVALGKSWRPATVAGIGTDENGDLWILNLHGVAMRLKDSLLIEPPPLMAEEPFIMPELTSDAGNRLYVLRNGVAARITPSGYQEERFGSESARPYFSRMTRSHDGGLWVAGENWTRKWDGKKWLKDFNPFPWGDLFVTTMLETSSHRLLIGTLLGGLYVLDEQGGWFHLGRTNGLPQDWVRSLMEDREHNIWVGTSGGLVLLRERKVAMYLPPDEWQGRPVMSITQSRDGAVWAGTEGAGVYRMDDGNWMHFGVSEGLSNLFVWAVMEDTRGQIWAGTWGGGLFRLDGGKFVRQFDLAELSAPVTALKESPPGTIWIGTGEGLMRFANGKLEKFSHLGGAAAGAVRAIESGAPGELWFGTQGAGLGHVRNGEFKTYRQADGLPRDFILSLHYDADGVLWIGTGEEGVCRFKDGRFASITTAHGLPNNIIDHIEEDGLGNMWFNSQTGIFRVRKSELNDCADGKTKSLKALVFGKAEGMTTLAGAGGFTPSGFRAPDGRLWFPTGRGLAVVDPKSVRPNPVSPPVIIEEIRVDGQPVDMRPLWASPTQPDRSRHNNARGRAIELPPGRRQLDVKFTGMSFTSPERVQFKYRLEGLDADWIEVGTRREVTYSYLPPGKFAFRVIACNSDGLWNDTGDAVAIVVLPYLWQTWWFKAALTVAACALVGGIVFLESRLRMKRKLERITRERELERERARIAQDIHDDLGASLTRIGMLSESAVGDLHKPQRTAASLNLINETTRELTRAMDEIVWAVNPRHDTLESLTNYISRFAQDFLSTAQIRCRLAMPLQVPEVSVRSEVRHNLFLAFKEVLHNVVKHSEANEVRITLQFVPGGFHLVVADNGAGFDPKRLNGTSEKNRHAPGNGLRNIRSRLAQIGGHSNIQSAPGEGTRVEFFVPQPDASGARAPG